MGLLDSIYSNVPLQIKTLLETMGGNTSDITAENLSDADKQRLTDVVENSRKARQDLLNKFPEGVMPSTEELGGIGANVDGKTYYIDREWAANNPENIQYAGRYLKHFPNQKAVKLFNEGGGTVNYDDYYNSRQGRGGDLDFTPSASIMNTFGQFRYNIDDSGNINVKDRYDFLNDYNKRVMPKSVADTTRYEGLSDTEKAKLIAKETISMPEQGFNPFKGIASLPSRVGNAYVGRENARNVNVNFPIDVEALKRIRGY
jgi:hypothetical protein